MSALNQSQAKSERLEGRCTKDQKDQFQYAVKLSGTNMTDFMVNALIEKANQIIEQYNLIKLSRRDQEAFANALLNPPAPSSALTKAKDRYNKSVISK